MKRRRIRAAGCLAVSVAAVACLGYVFSDHIILLALSLCVRRYDHGSMELVAYGENGHLLDSAGLLRRWRPTLIVRDLAESPVFGMPYGLGIPRVAVPVGEPVTLELLWNVPGFGKVLVDATNEGRGYRAPRDRVLRIELLPELARTRVFEVNEWVARHHQGTFASLEAARELDSASAIVREALRARDAEQRAMRSLDALRQALEAGEKEVLAEAQETIRTRRRGTLRIRVQDADGKPLPGVNVDVSQRRFDFLFGVYSDRYDAEALAQLKALGVNYVILFMTWQRTEPQPGTFSLQDFDHLFEFPELARNDFTVCAHALVWLANGEVPPYLEKLRGKPDDLAVVAREHVERIVGRYRSNVHIWEAINEGHPQWSRWGLDDDGLVQVAKASAEEIRKTAPGAPIMVEVTLPLGEDVALKHYPLINLVSLGRIGAASTDPYAYLQSLSHAGVPYDVVALQVYNGAWMNIAWGVQVPAIDLFRYARLLDRYASLGKPLQVAEIAVGSTHYGTPSENWWHAKADQTTQADYLEGVFTIAFGNLQVQGINWWGLYDDYRFVEAGGLFDESRQPKLAARRLADLLDGWRGNRRLTTGDDGWASFDGTAGDYRVVARIEADTVEADAHISQQRTNTLIVRHSPSVAAGAASR